MIQEPHLRLAIRPAARCARHAPDAHQVDTVVRRWAAFHGLDARIPFHLEVQAAPPRHAGLGSGTQLALAVAAGLNAFAGFGKMSPQQLAAATGRGQRSAVGTYGFVHGGLIAERGKVPGEQLAPLDCRLEFPADWSFVLVRPLNRRGLSGPREGHAFRVLPAVPAELRQRLVAQAEQQLVPAARRRDFAAFSAALYRFGRMAGSCFAGVQGGPYNGRQLADLVQQIRSLGVEGVGQSSWGPTLFALARDRSEAQQLARDLRRAHGERNLQVDMTSADNGGATVECSW